MVKSVLEVILVYSMSLAWIPKEFLEKVRRICSRFLWNGKSENSVTPWARWDRIVQPKILGGWGLKNIFKISKALATELDWRLSTNTLWTEVVLNK